MPTSAGSQLCPPYIQNEEQHRKAITEWMNRVSPVIAAASAVTSSSTLPWTSIMDPAFGADGTVSGNTLALQTAMNALSQGGTIVFPIGGFTFSSVTCTSPNLTLLGMGQRATTLFTNNTSVDVITVTAAGSGFCMRELMMDTVVTRVTPGHYVKAASGDTFIDRCYFQHGYHGIYFGSNNSVCVVNETQFRDFSNGGYCIEIESNGAAFYIRGVIMDHSAAAMPLAGIRIKRVQDCTISECGLIHGGNDLQIDPATADVVASVFADNTFFDTAGRGLLITGGNGGSTIRCRFDSCWFSSHTSQGILLDTTTGGGVIRGIDFVDPQCNLNASDAINIQGTNCTDINIYGGQACQNVGAGVGLGNQVHHVNVRDFNAISGYALTGNGFGIFFGNSLSNIEVTNCRFSGNASDATIPASVPITSVFRGNKGIRTKNQGSFILTAGQSVAVVTHSLAFTPAAGEVMLTVCGSLGAAGSIWLTAFSATTFTISANAAASVDVTIQWSADLEARNAY